MQVSLPTEHHGESSPMNQIQIEMVDNNSKVGSQQRMGSSKNYSKYQSIIQQNSQIFSKIENVNQYDVINFEKKQQPTYPRFKEKIDNLHMRKFNQKTKLKDLEYSCCGDVICGTSISGHCCWSTSEKTAVDERGVGVTLYFKGLKHLIWNYLFFTILSLPVVFFCVYASKNSSIEIDDFQTALQTTTVGNIGLDARQCYKGLIISASVDEYTMTCKTGNFAMKETFQWGLIYKKSDKINFEQQNCSFVDETKIDKSKNKDKDSIQKIKDCQNQESCTFSKVDILSLYDLSDYTDTQFFINSYCQGTIYSFPYFDLEKKYVAYIVSGIDAFIVLWYFLMIYCQGEAEEQSIENILKSKRTPSHFTIQISNLPEKIKSEADLMADLSEHLEKVVQEHANRERLGIRVKVIDVKISESQQEIIQQRKKGLIYKQNQKRVLEFLKKFDPKQEIIPEKDRKRVNITALESVAGAQTDKKLKALAQKEVNYLQNTYVEIGKAVEKIDKIENKSAIKYAWVTFDTIKMKNTAEEYLSTTTMERFFATICGCCSCCVPEAKVFKKKLMNVEPAPNPDSILWENNDSRGLLFRKIISFIITVGVLVGSYILIVWIRNAKQDIQQRYPSVDCSNPKFDNILSSIGEANVIAEKSKSSDQVKDGYIQCYCKKKINDIFSGSLDQPFKSICSDWLTDYSLSQFLPYAAVMCIIIINMILQVLFTLLSQFEKYKLLDDELKSRILKTFVAQFINTGLILLLTNINFDVTTDTGLQFLFGGNYTDLSPQWFKNVGTVIILTLLINVISAPLISLIFTIIREVSRCCDRGCSTDHTKTKKKTLNEWVDFYTGPEFLISFRYSQILGICFIGMLYSGGIPILYFTSFLHLSVLYWIDKIYLFKVSKLPLNFDEQMAKMVRRILYIVPFLHTIFSIYIYGNTDIFFEIQYLNGGWFDLSSSNAIIQKFIERVLQRQQNIAHAIILGLLIIMFLLRFFLYKPLLMLKNLCLQKSGVQKYMLKGSKNQQQILDQSYKNYLSATQLKDEVGLIEFYEMEQQEKEISKQCPKFQEQIKRKRQEWTQEYVKNKQNQISNIVGIFSYDIRHNPIYRKLYEWDRNLKSPAPSVHNGV